MPNIHEKFDMRGVIYCDIHFKVTPFARDLVSHCFKNGVEISRAVYEEAKAEYRKLQMVSNRIGG
jgi:hypothetical protein